MPSTTLKIVAISVSDMHLSHKPPLCRMPEPDWYAVMDRQLAELRQLSMSENVPVICAGDVFDKWNPPAELIEFAIRKLPTMYAVPGQHDLAYHNLDDLKRTGYGVLMAAGKIINIKPGKPMMTKNGICLHGFPWGYPLEPKPVDNQFNLAVVHKYMHTKKTGYASAPEDSLVSKWSSFLQHFKVTVLGDNHKSFKTRVTKQRVNGATVSVVNNGTFMRRTIDDKDPPKVSLIYSNGAVRFRELKACELDQVAEREDGGSEGTTIDLSHFLRELNELGPTALDFAAALKRVYQLNKTSKAVQRIISRALED